MSKRDPLIVRKTRALDVDWMLAYAERQEGKPIKPCFSSTTGRWFDQRETALAILHRQRLSLGSKAEMRTSRKWLEERGLIGPAWGPPYTLAQVRAIRANHGALERGGRP